jgi:hypothetical protein
MWDPRIKAAEGHGTAHTRAGSEPNASISQSCSSPDALPLCAFVTSSATNEDDLVSRLAGEDWEVVTSLVGSSRWYQNTMLSTTIMPSVKASVDDKPSARRRGGRRSTAKRKQRHQRRLQEEKLEEEEEDQEEVFGNRMIDES